jgi:D-3-phosphoglycerate dehydrogenase
MKKILIIQNIHEKGLEIFKNNPNFNFEVIEDVNSDELKKKIIDCDGVSIRTSKLTAEILEMGKNIKIISRHGVGYDNIDLPTVKKKNITLAITTNANAVAVAEHVMFMLLSISKRKDMYDKNVREGKFNERNKLPKTIELCGKNILIAGFGRVGQSLIKRCLGFEMNVFIYDPFVSSEKIEFFRGKKVNDFKEAIKIMDFLSLHMPLNDETKDLINLDLIKKMKRNCIIINAARGGIINELDLNKALNENLIFGAGIDVFQNEPPEIDNPLLKNDKAFLSPHTASFTEECMIRMAKETTQNIVDFFDNKLDKSKQVKL